MGCRAVRPLNLGIVLAWTSNIVAFHGPLSYQLATEPALTAPPHLVRAGPRKVNPEVRDQPCHKFLGNFQWNGKTASV